MFDSQKNVFWQALVLSLAVFAIGLFLGMVLENWRSSKIGSLTQQAELDLLDLQLQSNIYSTNNLGCNQIVQENIKFADRIYEEAKLLDQYESASRISDSIIFQHKKFDILRLMLWQNSIKVKTKCQSQFHIVAYLYSYDTSNLDIKAKQSVFSRLLGEIKQEYGDQVILIPLAGDNNLSSINLMMETLNISSSELPLVIIDEKYKIRDLESSQEIDKYLNSSSSIKLN